MSILSERHLLSARRAAFFVAQELRDHDEDAALRIITQAVSDFDAATTDEEIADFLQPILTTGDRRYDVLLASLTRWRALERRLTPPAWTDAPSLESEWLPGTVGTPLPEWRAIVLRETPLPLRERNILARASGWTVR